MVWIRLQMWIRNRNFSKVATVNVCSHISLLIFPIGRGCSEEGGESGEEGEAPGEAEHHHTKPAGRVLLLSHAH